MTRTRVRLVVTTFPAGNEEGVKKAARALVSRKLAACVWILPPMFSIYFWEGKVTQESEVLMVVKTSVAQRDQAVAALRELHPYSIPEIVTLKPEAVNPDYERWLCDYLSSSREPATG
jgi:periplasmic divalent cation tolerance protein